MVDYPSQKQPNKNINNSMQNDNLPNNQIEIVYGYTKKGYRYDTEGRYAMAGKIDENGIPLKPGSSNVPVCMFDTGNADIPGCCYDHHQSNKFPSASHLIAVKAKEFYEYHKDDKKLKLICHDSPDNDAIISLALASMIIDCKGGTPVGVNELVRIADESDTLTFKPGFSFGSMLDAYTKELLKSSSSPSHQQKISAINEAVAMVREMTFIYQQQLSKIQDPEKRKAYTFDTMAREYTTKGSPLYCQDVENARKMVQIRKRIEENTKKDELNYDICKRNIVNLADRDKQNKDKQTLNINVASESLSHCTFETNLCVKPLTKEATLKDFEKTQEKFNVFVYTGSAIPSTLLKLKAKEDYDVTIIPEYNKDRTKMTVRVSTGRKDINLGHFGRYIETLLYREKLNKEDSNIKDTKEFNIKRNEFIHSLHPLTGNQTNKHFTGYDSICGTDSTFFSYTCDPSSNLYSLQNLKNYMTDYFENPKKIKNKDFINMVGEENIDDIDKVKRPEVYAERQERKAQLEEIKMAEQVADLIVESGLNDKEASQVIEEMVDTNIDEAAFDPTQEFNELGE